MNRLVLGLLDCRLIVLPRHTQLWGWFWNIFWKLSQQGLSLIALAIIGSHMAKQSEQNRELLQGLK